MMFRSVSAGVLFICMFASVAAIAMQDIAVNRSTIFLLGNSRLDRTEPWQALFCRRENSKLCKLEDVPVTVSSSTKEALAGIPVDVFVYAERPGYVPFVFTKELQARPGDVEGAISERFELSMESKSVLWGNETIRMRREEFALVITKTGPPVVEQSFPLYHDPDNFCAGQDKGDLSLRTLVNWIGDLDRDQKPDFLINASAYRSCARTILEGPEQTDPASLLILSSRGGARQIGKLFVPGNRQQQR